MHSKPGFSSLHEIKTDVYNFTHRYEFNGLMNGWGQSLQQALQYLYHQAKNLFIGLIVHKLDVTQRLLSRWKICPLVFKVYTDFKININPK